MIIGVIAVVKAIIPFTYIALKFFFNSIKNKPKLKYYCANHFKKSHILQIIR